MTHAWLTAREVCVIQDRPEYCRDAPYDPSEPCPELPPSEPACADNPGFRAVRRLFEQMRFDSANAGTPLWNPLAQTIQRGETVFVKPNLVTHFNHGAKAFGLTDTDSLVTHGSVIRGVVEYVALALRGSGRVIIGDCPLQGADWVALVRLTGLERIAETVRRRFPGVKVEVRDYRLAKAELRNGYPVARHVEEWRRGEYDEVDLGRESLLTPLMGSRYSFGVSQYPRRRMRGAHTPASNRYLLPKDVLAADVLINVPKLKSHQKAGITVSLKNLVGINGHKDYLPHFRFGSPRQGGDEYPDGGLGSRVLWALTHLEWELDRGPFKRALIFARKAGQKALQLAGALEGNRNLLEMHGGAWFGNDTLWRTILDINRAFFHAPGRTRRTLIVVDGLVGGEKESPLAPTPVRSGYVLGGFNPVAVDAVATALMGFDVQKVKQVSSAFGLASLPLTAFGMEDVLVSGDLGVDSISGIYDSGAGARFEASSGYRGHIERHLGGERSSRDAHSSLTRAG